MATGTCSATLTSSTYQPSADSPFQRLSRNFTGTLACPTHHDRSMAWGVQAVCVPLTTYIEVPATCTAARALPLTAYLSQNRSTGHDAKRRSSDVCALSSELAV